MPTPESRDSLVQLASTSLPPVVALCPGPPGPPDFAQDYLCMSARVDVSMATPPFTVMS